MIIATLQFELHIHEPESLKDKRRVVKSVKDRLHAEHQVAVAEVAHQETLNLAVLGLAAVGSDGRHLGEVLDRISAKLAEMLGGEAELGACERRVIRVADLPEESAGIDEEALAREMLKRFDEGEESTEPRGP